TYAELPARLKSESSGSGGPGIDIAHVHPGEYVSFPDGVTLPDIARALNPSINVVLVACCHGRPSVCMTPRNGSTRAHAWLHRYIVRAGPADACPMSHLIMLAPGNFGSALAQLGKGRLGAIKAWFDGVEPGTGVLDWLELASPESLALNLRWIHDYPKLKLTR